MINVWQNKSFLSGICASAKYGPLFSIAWWLISWNYHTVFSVLWLPHRVRNSLSWVVALPLIKEGASLLITIKLVCNWYRSQPSWCYLRNLTSVQISFRPVRSSLLVMYFYHIKRRSSLLISSISALRWLLYISLMLRLMLGLLLINVLNRSRSCHYIIRDKLIARIFDVWTITKVYIFLMVSSHVLR